MTKSTVKKIEDLVKALEYFNGFHDASIVSIEFIKQRSLDNDGDLVYPFAEPQDAKLCDIRIRLLHNSYEGAKKKQVVEVVCVGSHRFSFKQDSNFDYSDVYRVDGNFKKGSFELNVLATDREIVSLALQCREIEFKEL